VTVAPEVAVVVEVVAVLLIEIPIFRRIVKAMTIGEVTEVGTEIEERVEIEREAIGVIAG
jgi:hypothetical protein